MIDLGVFGVDEYVVFPVQANGSDGSAKDLDSGSFTINFYESNPASSDAPAAMTSPDTTFNTKLDSKTGLYYGKVQMTAANGFEAGKQYFARVTGTIDAQTPAALFHWLVSTYSRKTVYDRVTTGIPNVAPAADGGLPTVNASNRIVGVQDSLATSLALSSIDTKIDANLVTVLSSIDSATSPLATSLALSSIDSKLDTNFANILSSIDSATSPLSTSIALASVGAAVDVNGGYLVSIDAAIVALHDFDPSSEEVDIGFVKGAAVSGVDDFKADVSALATAQALSSIDTKIPTDISTFDASTDEVDIGKVKGVEVTNVNDFKADVSSLATSAALAVVDSIVDTILVNTGTTIPGLISALNNISPSEVNAEVVDALTTDTIPDLSSIPSATPTVKQALMLLYMALRNEGSETVTVRTLKNNAGDSIGTATTSDSGTVFTKGKFS